MKKKYELTSDHRDQLKPWADKWIDIIRSTKPMDTDEREATIAAVNGMYSAAGLPTPKHIVFVPSPLAGNVAAGFAAAIWWLFENSKSPTRDATRDATEAATWDATEDKWVSELASVIGGNNSHFLVECAKKAINMADGGNHWAQYVSFLSFFRHIAKLDLPAYENFQHYETAAEHSSWRWMHSKFCIISDRPEILKWDDRHRPHCADGPSHRWRDGWEVYHWHGVRVPRQVVMSAETITTTQVDAESNQEIKRVMIERMGAERYVRDGGAREAHRDETGILWKRAEEWAAVEVVNGSKEPDGSRKTYFLQVPPEMRTATEAVAWTYGLTEMEYADIQIRT